MLIEIAEVSAYVFIDLLFNIMLAAIPFRKFSRLSKYKNAMLVLALFIVIVTFRIIGSASAKASGYLSALQIIVYTTCYIIAFSAPLNRMLFVLFVILNSGSFVAIINSYLTSHVLSDLQDPVYSLQYTGVYFLILICTYPILFHLMKSKVEPLISSGINNKAWNFIWIVPAIFCFSYYYNLFSDGGFAGYTMELANVIFTVVYNFGGLCITFLITGLVRDSNEFLQVRAENYMISLQKIQYDHMKNHLEEIRRAKHDMRQMLAVIQSGLMKNDINRLRDYVSKHMDAAVTADVTIHHCENFALNALLIYYSALAQKSGIEIKTNINYPEDSSLEETDMVILFGNLLENAYEACVRQTVSRMIISVVVRMQHDTMIITVDNPYNGRVKKLGGQFISSKNDGIGIGIASINKIVDKYHGELQFEYDKYVFKVSLFLKISNTDGNVITQNSVQKKQGGCG